MAWHVSIGVCDARSGSFARYADGKAEHSEQRPHRCWESNVLPLFRCHSPEIGGSSLLVVRSRFSRALSNSKRTFLSSSRCTMLQSLPRAITSKPSSSIWLALITSSLSICSSFLCFLIHSRISQGRTEYALVVLNTALERVNEAQRELGYRASVLELKSCILRLKYSLLSSFLNTDELESLEKEQRIVNQQRLFLDPSNLQGWYTALVDWWE